MEFGDRLREARVNKGLTQEQLAKKIGVAKSTLAGYEKGNREPDVFKIKKIIEALGIDAERLYYIIQGFNFRWFFRTRRRLNAETI